MPQTIESMAEQKWRTGKSFLFLHSELALAGAATDQIILRTNSQRVTIESIEVTSDADLLEWKAWMGATVTPATGTAVPLIPRNLHANSTPHVDVIVNPTITDKGIPFFTDPIDLVGQAASGSRSYIDEFLIENLFSLANETDHLIEITNKDAGAAKYTLTINIFKD